MAALGARSCSGLRAQVDAGRLARPAMVQRVPCHTRPAQDQRRSIAARSTAWSPEDLARLADESERSREEALGAAWSAQFNADLDGLFEYVNRGVVEWYSRVKAYQALDRQSQPTSDAKLAMTKFPAGVANEVIGMGMWRLKGSVDPLIELLTARIEGLFREMLEYDLSLYPTDKWKGATGFDLLDSLDPGRELEGWSWCDCPDPPRGGPDWPRLLVENRLYCSKVFRKLHLEVAARQDGLHILHAVLYPRYAYDLPILAMDVVVANGRPTLAIIDPCPVRDCNALPAHYAAVVDRLQERFLDDAAASRRVPDWGKAIFSDRCVCIRPDTPEQLQGFVRYAIALTRAHLLYANLLSPVGSDTKRQVARAAELHRNHARFCEKQLENKKTRAVLAAAFGEERADAYMSSCMFDYNAASPDDPPFTDGAIRQLYHYMSDNPEPWPDADRYGDIVAGVEATKAADALAAALGGGQVNGQRLEAAMEFLYSRDASFAIAVNALLPDAQQLLTSGKMGAALAQKLQAAKQSAAR